MTAAGRRKGNACAGRLPGRSQGGPRHPLGGSPGVSARRGVHGFTLIEMLITLAVLALLATVVAPLAQVTYQRTKERELRLALREIRSAIDSYKRASDLGRIRKEAGATGYPPNLQKLVDGEEDQQSPKKQKIFFIRRIPPDPMADDATVPAAQMWGLRAYASEAADPKPGDDVYDVHTKSELKGLNGVAYRQW